MSVELMQRAFSLALVEPTDDGQFRVTDSRFIESGASQAHLGVPLDVVLDEWEALVAHTEEIAERFIGVFERQLAPSDWQSGPGTDEL